MKNFSLPERSPKDLRLPQELIGTHSEHMNAPFISREGSLRALKLLDKRSEDAARVPSPLLAHVRDKFKKAKPTAEPRIPLDQRLVDPSSLEKEESLESAPSPARTVNPNDPGEDAEIQGEGNQNAASASKSSDSGSSSASEVLHGSKTANQNSWRVAIQQHHGYPMWDLTSPTGFYETPHDWDTTICSNKRPTPLPRTWAEFQKNPEQYLLTSNRL